ncbi:hypothetical protein ES705_32756 [subsurface metagenome]
MKNKKNLSKFKNLKSGVCSNTGINACVGGNWHICCPLNNMPQSHLEIYIHFVWTTKYRDALIKADKRKNIFRQIKNISEEKGYHVLIINGVENHVHCLIRLKHSQMI